MPPPFANSETKRCRLLRIVTLSVAVIALGWVMGRAVDPARVSLQDFVEYWAAGRLNAFGENPYDAVTLYEQERQVSPGLTEAIMMWNPPWTLSLVMPFGLLPAHVGFAIWVLGNLVLVVWCAGMIWRNYDGPAQLWWVPWIVALGFAPTFFVLRMGQISAIVLLGIVAFLYCERRARERGGAYAWLGATLALAAIKPHLVLVFTVAVFLWNISRRQWSVFLVGVLSLLALTAAPLACNPSILGQFWEALAHRPPQMLSPTLGSVLRLIFGLDHFRLQFVPTIAGVAWVVTYWWRKRRTWDWAQETPLLLLVSFLTASYGAWPFDLVVLLVPVIRMAAWLCQDRRAPAIRFGITALVGFDVTALLMMNVRYSDYYWYAWTTPMLLYCYLSIRRERNRESALRTVVVALSPPKPLLAVQCDCEERETVKCPQ